MININGLDVCQGKEGYTISFTPVMSSNEGTAADGTSIGTMLGKRPVITITTNQMAESDVMSLLGVLYSNKEYTVIYPLPIAGGYGKQKFKLTSDLAIQYKHMRHGKIAPITITLTAVDARFIAKN